jgi:hypothetical protein
VGVDGGGVEEAWVLSIVCERLTTGCTIIATFGAGGTDTYNYIENDSWDFETESVVCAMFGCRNGMTASSMIVETKKDLRDRK